MPKPITAEMLHAMSLDQRKTLHRNAMALDTPAAREVLELLAQDDLMGRRKPPVSPAAAKKAGAASARKRVKSEADQAKPKPIKVVFGRQA